MQVTLPRKEKKEPRGPVLFARVKPINHQWMKEQAELNGYDSVSEFTDALIDGLRAAGDGSESRRKK